MGGVLEFLLLFWVAARARLIKEGSYNETLADYLVDFAAASYCCGNLGKGVATWSCSACKKHPEVTFVKTFSSDIFTSTNGFVAYAKDSKKVILTVTGTDPLYIGNWIDDADFFLTDWKRPDCPGCKLDEGFLRSYLAVKSQIFSLMNEFHTQFKEVSGIWITGHSLGASLALIAAVELEDAGYNITEMYSFGEPRLGNDKTAAYVMSRYPNNHFRVVHHRDPIPHLAPELLGYRHPAREVWYPGSSTGKYVVCDGTGEDNTCSNSLTFPVNLVDHWGYLNQNFFTNYLGCKLSG